MRRAMFLLPLIGALSACSPGQQHRATNDIKAAAGDVPGAIRDGTDSAHGAQLQAEVKDLAKATGTAAKEGAEQAKQALDSQVDKQKTPPKKGG